VREGRGGEGRAELRGRLGGKRVCSWLGAGEDRSGKESSSGDELGGGEARKETYRSRKGADGEGGTGM
jgi:hypothetical protein